MVPYMSIYDPPKNHTHHTCTPGVTHQLPVADSIPMRFLAICVVFPEENNKCKTM